VSLIESDEGAKDLVRAQIGLAKVLDMRTIGEGVETPEQKAFLVEQGCDYLQGYLFDRPLCLADWQVRLNESGPRPGVAEKAS
jgi:EAL domain-containing protein (putative c-di-GMP-specific phosphodiesterase class I)